MDSVWKQRHEAHLKTEYWQVVRRKVRLRVYSKYDQLCCERCGVDVGPFETHHLDYTILGRELDYLHLLLFVCEDCHDFLHQRGPDPRTSEGLHKLIDRI